jgi:hypothetical protein
MYWTMDLKKYEDPVLLTLINLCDKWLNVNFKEQRNF